MDRLLNIGAAGILICIVAAIVLNQLNDPFQSRRKELGQRWRISAPRWNRKTLSNGSLMNGMH